jgi:hypothetical protein
VAQEQPAPAPPAQEQRADSGAPAVAPAPQLTVRSLVSKLAAKKARKGKTVSVGLATTAPLTAVTAQLVNAKKQVLGKGSAASLASAGSLKVKLSKSLKRGSYTMVVAGTDAQGRMVTASRRLTVR